MRLESLSIVAASLARSSAGGLAEGLTFAWTTPILRLQLVPADSEALELVAGVIIDAWTAHKDQAAMLRGRTLSDAFFEQQRDGFHAGGAHLLGQLTGAAGDVMRTWHQAWQNAIMTYVDAAAGPDAARSLSARRLALFAWAGVHERCSRHASHFHEEAAVSGVFYLAAPNASGTSGAFVADDPRGPRPPFENRLRHQPRRGELLLFPPWLRHGVESVGECKGHEPSAPRIAISFNLGHRPHAPCIGEAGDGHACKSDASQHNRAYHSDDGAPLWEVLADASVNFDGMQADGDTPHGVS